MSIVEVVGKIEVVDAKARRVRVGATDVTLTEKAFGHVDRFPTGTVVSVKLGHGKEGYFIEEVGADVAKAPIDRPKAAPWEAHMLPGQFRPIGNELMKECLRASVENWKELIGTLDKPGPYFEQVGPLDKVLVFEQIVATAQSMFISATKMSY